MCVKWINTGNGLVIAVDAPGLPFITLTEFQARQVAADLARLLSGR